MVKKFPQMRVPHHFLYAPRPPLTPPALTMSQVPLQTVCPPPTPHRIRRLIHRSFGTGVLIATAFVHLLPTAFTSLTDPCLPPFWTTSYPAMPGLIAMLSVFFVVTIEMIFASMNGGSLGGCHSADSTYSPLNPPSTLPTRPRHRRTRSGSIGHQLSQFSRPAESSTSPDDDSDSDATETEGLTTQKPVLREIEDTHSHRLTPDQQSQKSLLQVLLLEAGILFHSIFIGMALSVTSGPSFLILLLAIVFHQTFEGLALGSRIAALTAFPDDSYRPWLMCLAYGTTTPIGQAIGLVTREMYDPQSQTGLLMVGIMNAVSSGLLLFAGLVELLAEDFLSDESYRVLRGWRRVEAAVSVAAGAAGMALVGAWA